MSESSIYREALLKHIRHPKNVGSLDNPDLKASVYNPLCGDELELNITLSEGKIRVITEQKKTEYFEINSGVIEMQKNKIIVLAE